jgi:hypothetical protein
MKLFSKKKKPEMEDNFEPVEEKTSTVSEIIQFSLIAILIVVPIRMFVAQPFIVSGDSMFDSWGALQEERIIGRAYLRLFPPTTVGYLPGHVADQVNSS